VGNALHGLVHDPADLVHLFLTTVRTKIVENFQVVKKLKQAAFNTRVLESLVTLYEWQGRNSAGFAKFKKKKVIKIESVCNNKIVI